MSGIYWVINRKNKIQAENKILNRDGYSVVFEHLKHQNLGITCGYCHHLSKPDDKTTGCYECHYDMYLTGDAFNHNCHSNSNGANIKCFECHSKNISKGKVFRYQTVISIEICNDCHKELIPDDSRTKILNSFKTLSYTDAMRNFCIDCHRKKLNLDTVLQSRSPNLDKCSNCHQQIQSFEVEKKIFRKDRRNKWVVIPSS